MNFRIAVFSVFFGSRSGLMALLLLLKSAGRSVFMPYSGGYLSGLTGVAEATLGTVVYAVISDVAVWMRNRCTGDAGNLLGELQGAEGAAGGRGRGGTQDAGADAGRRDREKKILLGKMVMWQTPTLTYSRRVSSR